LNGSSFKNGELSLLIEFNCDFIAYTVVFGLFWYYCLWNQYNWLGLSNLIYLMVILN